MSIALPLFASQSITELNGVSLLAKVGRFTTVYILP